MDVVNGSLSIDHRTIIMESETLDTIYLDDPSRPELQVPQQPTDGPIRMETLSKPE